MLRRHRNAGVLVHRRQEAGPGNWPAPLDEATWRSLVAFLDDPSRRTTPGNERKYLGSGLYVCGVCSSTVRCGTSNRRADKKYFAAYNCRVSKHVVRKAEPLDDYVQLLVLDRVAREDAADLLAAREDPVDVRGAQKDMREARRTLDELAKELGSGAMDLQEWRVASAAARARKSRAEETLSRAVEANPVAGLVGADDVEAEWKGLDLSRKRAVIDYLMTVTVHPARRGRLPGGVYFDTESIQIDWK